MARLAQFSVFSTVLLMVSAVFGQAHANETVPMNEPAATKESETFTKIDKPLRTGIAGSFLSGRFARENKDLKQAAKYINASLAKDPTNLILASDALRLNLLAGNMDIAIGLAKKSEAASDPIVASLRMLEAVKSNDFDHAQKTMEDVQSTGLFGLIKPIIEQWILLGMKGNTPAPDLQPAIEKAGFFAPFLNYHLALMQDISGNKVEAEAAFLKANTNGTTSAYRVVQALANFYARTGRAAEAEAVFDAYMQANPHSNLAPDTLRAGEVPHPLVSTPRDGLAEVYFTTASLLFGDASTQDTFLYLRVALELRPDLAPAQLMLANLYEQVGDYAQAIKTYDAIAPETVFGRRAQVRKALNYEAMGDRKKALELLEVAAKDHPKESIPLITKGDMLRDAKDFKGAAAAYSEAIRRSEPLRAGDWPLLYARGICYERAGNWGSAEPDFNRALGLQPNQPDVLNYLAYTWLTLGKNISKAREYLALALAARSDDPHIVDSAGYAAYLAGDFKAAVEKYERAIQLMPDDSTVNEHLGDAYWRSGRQTEARFQWGRALNFKPERDAEVGLKEKLAKGMPPFQLPPSIGAEIKQNSKLKMNADSVKSQVQ